MPTGDNMNVPARFKLNWPWEYNLDAAKEKLTAIDFPAAFANTTILYQTSVNSVRQKNQEIVKQDLEQLGFTVELKSIDSGVFFSSDAGNPDTLAHFYADIQMYTNGPGTPYPIAWAARYRADQIAEQGEQLGIDEQHALRERCLRSVCMIMPSTTIDEAEQDEIWTEMLSLVYEDIVEVPIVWRGGAAAVHNRIAWVEDVSPWQPTPIDQLMFWTLA